MSRDALARVQEEALCRHDLRVVLEPATGIYRVTHAAERAALAPWPGRPTIAESELSRAIHDWLVLLHGGDVP